MARAHRARAGRSGFWSADPQGREGRPAPPSGRSPDASAPGGAVVGPMTKPLSPNQPGQAATFAGRCAAIPATVLAADLLEQQVVPVGRPGVQDAVLPVGARPHQLFAVWHPGGLEHLLRLLQITHAELPSQHAVGPGGRESLVPLDTELNRAVAKREAVGVLGALVGHAEPEAEVEIPFSAKIADEENRDDPPKQRCHSAT